MSRNLKLKEVPEMAKDIKELIRDLHCLLKIVVLVIGIVKIGMFLEYFHNFTEDRSLPLGCAYPLTILTIIIALLITIIFFESTRITEICLLICCAILLLDSMITYDYLYGHYNNDKAKNRYIVFMILCIAEFALIALDIIFHILKK